MGIKSRYPFGLAMLQFPIEINSKKNKIKGDGLKMLFIT